MNNQLTQVPSDASYSTDNIDFEHIFDMNDLTDESKIDEDENTNQFFVANSQEISFPDYSLSYVDNAVKVEQFLSHTGKVNDFQSLPISFNNRTDHGTDQLKVSKSSKEGRALSAIQRPCLFEGCHKCAQAGTKYCISHGGGRRCTYPNCTKGARDKNFCASHGGGKRCTVKNCDKSAVGRSTFCTSHGGGKRCAFDGCEKSAQSGHFCVRHGGGKHCSVANCLKVI
jgi:hypothetical protein